MKLEDITACKLYKSSPRKQQILIKASSAIKTSKALNVQQPWQVDMPANKQDTDNAEIEDVADMEQQGDDGMPISNNRPSAALKSNVHTRKPDSSKSGSHSSMSEGASKSGTDADTPDASDDTLNTSSDASDDSSDTSSSTDNVDSATNVTASCGVSLPRIDVTDDMRNQVESIKGTLNSQQLTCGVTRVAVKDDEVWCYYNDSVNLNEVMVEAIDLVSKAGYSYLEFNRLARSDNAIVFVIIKNDTARTLAPEQGVSTKQEE